MPKTKLETSYLIAFSLLGLFPIVIFIIKPFLLVPLLAVSLYNLFFVGNSRVNWTKVLISSSIYLLFAFSMFYSTDFDRAIKMLIRLTPFLTLPIGFALVPKSIYNKLTEVFIKVYTISCSLYCFVILIYCISLKSTDIYYIYSYMSNKFWGYEDHPIYISLYFGIALILLLFKSKKTIVNVFIFVIIFFTLLFLSRKGNIIGLILILFYMLISNSKIIFNKYFFRYTLIGIIIIVGVSIIFNNFLFTRFKEVINLSQYLNNPESSTGIRSILWRISLNLSFDSPFFGYGLGSVQTIINSSLIGNGYKSLTTIHHYNAHNQYLQIALTAGYISLTLFVSILAFIYYKIKNNKLAICIFFYIVFCFIFESLLERQNGIIITALFFNLFLFLPKTQKD